jgi:Ca2+-binding RTX toxin-like protein
MFRVTVSSFLALALGATLVAALAAAPAEAGRHHRAHPPMMLGPGDAHVSGIGGTALIRRSKFGYVYIAGKQSSHLRITFVQKHNSLRYRDTHTHRITQLPPTCQREDVKIGVSAVCKIQPRFADQRMFVQVWPRLGNDYVDGRTLPWRFRLWVLADGGRDVVYGGAGDDFVNGARDGDRAYGGHGNDFLRGGPGANHLVGGAGKDKVRS